MNCTVYNENGNEWIVASYPGFLGVQKNGVKKWVRVEDDHEFIYKLMKTKIKAAGGAEGLHKYIARCIAENFCTAFALKVLNYAADEMKPAKI